MNDTLKVFAEIFFSFLAAAGAVFMMNELYELIKYRRKKAGLPIIVDTRRFTPEEINEITLVYLRLMKRREASRLLGSIVFVTDEKSRVSEDTLNGMSEKYTAIVLCTHDSLGALKDIIE